MSNTAPVRRRWRLLFGVALIIVFVVCVNIFSRWLGILLEMEVRLDDDHMIHGIIIISLIVYTVFIAIPFVPSVEVGWGLMLLLGADLAPLVYLFTVIGLSASYIIGRRIPESRLQTFLEELSLTRAGQLVGKLKALDTEQRLALLLARAPARFIPTLVRHRYLAVAVALNIPGNTVIGGGGGISLVAGMSRLFGFCRFVLTLTVAVAPVPLLIVIFGTDLLR